MTPHPLPSTPNPPHNDNARLYYESYVAQAPSWNLVASGWLDATGVASQAYGSGEMIAATYNLPVQTRVWDEDVGAWGPWVGAVPAGGAPDKGALVTPPTASSGPSGTAILAGTALVGLVAVLLWPR